MKTCLLFLILVLSLGLTGCETAVVARQPVAVRGGYYDQDRYYERDSYRDRNRNLAYRDRNYRDNRRDVRVVNYNRDDDRRDVRIIESQNRYNRPVTVVRRDPVRRTVVVADNSPNYYRSREVNRTRVVYKDDDKKKKKKKKKDDDD